MTANRPPCTSVGPAYEFVPVSTRLPQPIFVKPPVVTAGANVGRPATAPAPLPPATILITILEASAEVAGAGARDQQVIDFERAVAGAIVGHDGDGAALAGRR